MKNTGWCMGGKKSDLSNRPTAKRLWLKSQSSPASHAEVNNALILAQCWDWLFQTKTTPAVGPCHAPSAQVTAQSIDRQTGRRRVLIAHAHCARSLPESGTCATGCQSASVTRSAFDGHLMRSGSEKREEKVIRWIVSGLDTDLKRDQPPFSIEKNV